jgi:hypothetical protein
MFLNALTYVQEDDAEGFKEALRALVEKYPDADVSALAGEMLKGVLRGRTMVQGGMKGMIWNLQFGGEGELSAADSALTFIPEKNIPYQMLLMYPAGSLDKNQLLFAVAAYNFSNFLVKELDLVQEETSQVNMLRITGFINFDEIHQYYNMICGKDGYVSALGSEVAVIPIANDNYSILMRGKTLDDYIAFLEKNFGEEAPELVGRLKARSEEAKEDTEMEEEESEKEETQLQIPEGIMIPEEIIIPMDTVIIEQPVLQDSIQPVLPDSIKDIEAQYKKEHEELLRIQKAEDEALLKAKAEQEKRREQERKDKLKQAEADRKAKQKAQEQLRKQKEKERKEKEKLYRQKLREKEQARRESQKAKEKERREKERNRK